MSRRFCVDCVARNGATNWALIVALETALLEANVRSSSASGSMNETRISDPIASTSRMTRSLISGSRWRGQLHPDTPDGVQVSWPLGALPELAPQPGDMHVNGLVGATVGHPPDVSQHISLRHHLASPHRQVIQQVELASRQVERAALKRRLVRGAVEAKVTDKHRFAAPGLVGHTAQHRPHPGFDLADAKRLDQVVIGSGVEHLHDFRLIVSGGGYDDRYLADRPQHPERLVAVEVRQPEIEY